MSAKAALPDEVIGRPWYAEVSKRDPNRVIVRRTDGAWICDLDGDFALPFAELIALSVNRDMAAKLAYVPDIVKNAMLVAWSEICSDTGCHPLDIEHGAKRFLTFEPRHWAQMVGQIVAVQIEKLLDVEPRRTMTAQEEDIAARRLGSQLP